MKKMRRLMALLLTLAMVLPMTVGILPVSAEEAVAELPTETISVDTATGAESEISSQRWDFGDASQLADFDLYQSGTSQFVISDGRLKPDGTDGEVKAIVNKDFSKIESISVDIMPGESGLINGGLVIGVTDPSNNVDGLNAMAFYVMSDWSGWTDAPNRIDIVQGQHAQNWTELSRTISESVNNPLFTGGKKEPLNLRLDFGDDFILLTLSLVRNPSKCVQKMYDFDSASFNGKIGLRNYYEDTCYDQLIINQDRLPGTLWEGIKLDGTGVDSSAKTTAPMTQKPTTIETWVKMDKLPSGSQRQAIISSYNVAGLDANPAGTWGLYTNESGTLWYTERSANGTFKTELNTNIWTNKWIHIAIVRGQGVVYLYINGELVQSLTSSAVGDSTALANYLTIGYSVVCGATHLNAMKGEIGDIRLWSTERSQEQIQANMYRELEGTEDGLLQHWNFDSQEKGIVSNTVSGGLDCVLLGSTQLEYAPETLWEGVKLDGTGLDSYVKTTAPMTVKPTTIETWVKMDQLPSGSQRQAIISSYNVAGLDANPAGTWGLYTTETGTLWYTERSSNGTFKTELNANVWNNEWTHIAIVRGQGIVYLYINGELIQSLNSSAVGDSTALSNYLTIGYSVVWGATHLNAMKGEIGDIRLWSTERSQEQILANMYQELDGTEEGLIQHWNFDSQEKGIVSNTVSGGLDCVLLGHTQIGNEEIRRWDFSDASQLEDFTWYASDDGWVQQVSITDGMLYSKGQHSAYGAPSSSDAKAVLNETIDNITYIGADVTQGDTPHAFSGFIFGIKDINSETAWDYDGFLLRMGRYRTGTDKLPWGEMHFQRVNYAYPVNLNDLQANQKFFPNATTKLPYHIQAEITGNTVNALMYRLDDPTISNSMSYTFADGDLDGQIGLFWRVCTHSYDNFTVVSKLPDSAEVEPEQGSVDYLNEGYGFYRDEKSWKLSEELTETPYTVEAWVKIPAGLAENSAGYILSNAARAPYISLEMLAGGKLRLGVGAEDEGLAIVSKNYDVDTDLRTGKWTHIAYTMDATADQVVAYINGEAVATWNDAELPAFSFPDHIHPSNKISIGSFGKSSAAKNDIIASDPLMGFIADVRMWNRPLSAQEVKDSMLTQYTQSREGLMVNVPLHEKQDNAFADLSGNGYTVTEYSDKITLEAQTHEPGAYSMIVIPDQQILTTSHPDKLNNLYQWIAENREKENIQMVMTVGDNVDHNGNVTEWENAKAAWELLPDDLPFVAVPGNHDYDAYGVEGNRSYLTLMNQYFPQSLFAGYSTEIGFFDEVNSANHWQAFAVNGHPYLIMALEYIPQDDVIAWANEVVEAHPDHQVIMVTHSYVGNYGELDRPYLWSEFMSKHENIIMGFSGHVQHGTVVHRTDEGVNGNPVHNILMDAQFADATTDGYAMVGILRFNADGTLCNVSYYSTDKDMYDATSNFTLEIPAPKTIVAAQVGEKLYTTVTEAAANANGEVVEILLDTDEAITISADVIIDLAGKTLTNVTVAEGKLMLIDTVSGGSATVTGSVEALTEADGKTYLVVGESGVYSAHEYSVALTHISLDPTNDALGYKAELIGDDVVKSHVKSFGFNLWVQEDRVVTKSIAGKTQATLRLKNILANKGGEMTVYGNAFVVFDNEETVTSADYGISMKQVMQMVNENWAAYSKTQQTAVKALCDQHYDTVSGWELTNIYPATEAAA